MKSLLVALIIFISLCGSGCGKTLYVYAPVDDYTLINSSAQLLDFEETPRSLNQILSCINAIEYEDEEGDDWKSPMRTLFKEIGDCEDKALVGAYFAEKMGYEPIIMDIKWKEDVGCGHMVTVLKKNGKYGLIDENILIYPHHTIRKVINKETS